MMLWFTQKKKYSLLVLKSRLSLFYAEVYAPADDVDSQATQKHSHQPKGAMFMKRALHKRKDKIRRRCVFWKLTTTRISTGSAVARSASELFTFSTMQISCV